MGENKNNNTLLGEQCKALLKFLVDKGIKKILIAQKYHQEYPRCATSVDSVKVSLSKIFNGDYTPHIITNDLLAFLDNLNKNTPDAVNYDSTIIFYYWSEGIKDLESDDMLKVAHIQISLQKLSKNTEVDCNLKYERNEDHDHDDSLPVLSGDVLLRLSGGFARLRFVCSALTCPLHCYCGLCCSSLTHFVRASLAGG